MGGEGGEEAEAERRGRGEGERSHDTPPPQLPPPHPSTPPLLSLKIVGNLNKRLLLGALVGGVAGAYYQQQFGAPSVKEQYEKWKKIVLDSVQAKKS